DENAALQQRIIARFNGLHSEAANSRPGKNRLGDNGSGEKGAELQTENGENGNQRVAKRVAQQHGAFGEAFRARCADVIASQLFEHGGAHHARENRGERGSQRDGRKDQMRDAATSADRQPTDEHGENQDKQRAERKIRNGESKQSEKADGVVGGFSAALRGEQARGNSNRATNDERGEGKLERGGIVFENDVEHGLLKTK